MEQLLEVIQLVLCERLLLLSLDLATKTLGSPLLENLTLSSLSTPPAEGSLKEGNANAQ